LRIEGQIMEDYPLVSYVVVTHERPPHLVRGRIINTILQQEYPRKELILVGEECPNLNDIGEGLAVQSELERFLSINLERPRESELCVWALVARARNVGIRAAQGEYICCQDDDNELIPEFTKEMLETIRRNNALAAWCWRRVLEPNGQPFSGDYFPWIQGDELRRRILYKIWSEAGVIQRNSCVIRDTLWAVRGSERFSTVDPNEWLVHKDVYRLVPYRECYTHNEIAYHVTFDDIWDEDFTRSGLPAACWQKPGLVYYLGGTTNTKPRTLDFCDDKR